MEYLHASNSNISNLSIYNFNELKEVRNAREINAGVRQNMTFDQCELR